MMSLTLFHYYLLCDINSVVYWTGNVMLLPFSHGWDLVSSLQFWKLILSNIVNGDRVFTQILHSIQDRFSGMLHWNHIFPIPDVNLAWLPSEGPYVPSVTVVGFDILMAQSKSFSSLIGCVVNIDLSCSWTTVKTHSCCSSLDVFLNKSHCVFLKLLHNFPY